MSYAKGHTIEAVKPVLHQVNGKGYVLLLFHYGYMEEGKHRPFKCSTGVTVKPEQWKDGGFVARKINGKPRHSVEEGIEQLRQRIHNTFSLLCDQLERLPSPEEIREALKEEERPKNARTSFAEWIREQVPQFRKEEDSTFLAPLTQRKYLSIAHWIEAVEEGRKSLPQYAKRCRGRGRIFLESFSEKDFADLSLLIDLASCNVPKVFGKYGIEAVTLNGGGYRITSKEKVQGTLKQLLRKAQDLGFTVNANLDSLKKVRRGAPAKQELYLKPEEVEAIIEHHSKDRALENARRLLLLHIFTGCRSDELQRVLSAPIEYHKQMPLMKYASKKSHTKVCSPIFLPIQQFLLDPELKPVPVMNQILNGQLKRLCKEVGLDRSIHTYAKQSNGSYIDRHRPLWQEVSTHIGRRSCYSLVAGHLNVDNSLVTKCLTGHKNRKEVHMGYDKLSAEDTAHRLWRIVSVAQDILPFKLVP